MAGQETHGYDLVLEVAEETVADIVANVFSDSNLACAVLDALAAVVPSNLGVCDDFVLTINFDRPAGVPLPADARSPIDIRLDTGNATAGTRTRMVVGFDVGPADVPGVGEFDTIRLNFRDELYFAETVLRVLGSEQPFVGDEAQILRSTLPPVVVLAIPVDRDATDPAKIRSADVFTVDDSAAGDRDAIAVGLTAAGGTAGDPTAFLRSFVPDGSSAALALSAAWLCRVLDPKIAAALHIDPAKFQDCRLTEAVEVTIAGETVELTSLELTIGDGEIGLAATVRQTGFCYEATGKVAARLTISAQNGELVITHDIDEPDVDIDVPWYCWLAGIALIVAGIGIALVSVIVGVIVAIVGALVIVALFILKAVVGSAIGSVADAISAALETALGGVDGLSVPIADIDFDLIDAFIDDVTLGFHVVVKSAAGIRGEGDLYVPNDHAVDLDTGAVGPAALVGADLRWSGADDARHLATACAAGLARTARTRIDDLSPYKLRLLDYGAPVVVPFAELFRNLDLGFFEFTLPTFTVLGVRTTEDRYAVVQAVGLTDDYVVLRYRTYEKVGPTLDVGGNFGCAWDTLVPFEAAVAFEPTAVGPVRPIVPGRAGLRSVVGVPAIVVPDAVRRHPDLAATLPFGVGQVADPGRWLGPRPRRSRVATLRAVTSRLTAPLGHAWVLDGNALGAAGGTIEIDGGRVSWTGGDTDAVTLTIRPDGPTLDLPIEVTVTDAGGVVARTVRCIHWTNECPRPVVGYPTVAMFGATWRRAGLRVIELPPLERSSAGPG